MKQTIGILVLSASFIALSQTGLAEKRVRRPNVIVVLTDDQGFGDMSCHGNPYLKTPALDRLHAEGIRLADFHVDPTCSPTRAALMTGRYSARVGVWLTYASRNHLRRDEVTMADVFRQNGYRTAIFGKWHLGDNYPFRPTDRGFDESLIHGGGVVGEAPDYWNNNYYDDVYLRSGKPEQVGGYCTDVWFNEAMSFIDENKDRPFFVYLPTNAAHAPFHVPETYAAPYEEIQPARAAFYGMIANIDENLGRLREHLKRLSLDRDTILVFLNDNGTAGGVSLTKDEGGNRNGRKASGYDAGLRGKKASRYEGGHRAACFIHWPKGGLTGGRDVDGVTAHIDLLPTLIDLCDLQFEDRSRFDGLSLAPVLTDPDAVLPERSVVVHHQGRFGNPVGEGLLIKDKDYSVMRGTWRLVGRELYDLSNDPSQRHDIAAEFPEIAKSLRQDYEAWWDGIAQRSDEYCPFVINPAKQREVKITSQSLLGGEVAYSQRHVRSAVPINGWTVIDVEVPGRYRISLRRWPKEANAAIRATVPPCPMHPSTHRMKKVPCRAVEAIAARLKVGRLDKTVPVNEKDKEVAFDVDLTEGKQRLQTWFILAGGERIAAYYTYIEPLRLQ
jgi:arylsulfatase A-like enzyme